ncbi:hypothetical protein ABVK25_011754 [Lepraria finkii]|uniref:Legume lectin domain-containing protein n=1 Tax=Lepraria finkii TaxID=1340010 RepID=A0ABR4AM20_9LECA
MHNAAAPPIAAFMHIQNFALNGGVHLDGDLSLSLGHTSVTSKPLPMPSAPALLSGRPTPSSSSIQAVDWIISLSLLASPNTLQQLTLGYNLHDDFSAKSFVVPSSAPLTTDALNS